jgi:hypothetical protein
VCAEQHQVQECQSDSGHPHAANTPLATHIVNY